MGDGPGPGEVPVAADAAKAALEAADAMGNPPVDAPPPAPPEEKKPR
jgi:hypothetical protein